MLDKELTPEELTAQSQEMSSLMSEYESVFSKTNSLLTTVNSNWSANLANNFAAKMVSSQKVFNQIVAMLNVGSELARTSAEDFVSLDSLLAKSTWDLLDAVPVAGTSSVAMNESTSDTSDKSFWERLWENGVEVWNETWETLPEAWEVTGEFIDALCENYENLPDWAKELFKKALDVSGLKDYSSAWEVVKDIITGDVDWDTGETVIKAITKGTDYTVVGDVWSHMTDYFDEMLDSWVIPATEISYEPGGLLTVIADVAGVTYGFAGELTLMGINYVSKLPGIGNILNGTGVASYANDRIRSAENIMFDMIEDLSEAEKEWVGNATEAITDFAEDAVGVVTDLAEDAGDLLSDAGEALADAGEAIAGGVSKVWKTVSDFWP